MAHFPLSSNSDWELKNADQDIRGWEVRDSGDNRLGAVTHMLMNTETEMVDFIRLDTGRELATVDVHIGEDIVYYDFQDVGKLPAGVIVHDGHGQLARRSVLHDPVFATYDDVLRSHHGRAFGEIGWPYEFYLPGYRFGYTLASEETNADKTYEQIEPLAKEAFVSRHGGSEYSDHREAIRHGYEYHRKQIKELA